jgi:hypothetical protein
MFSVTDALNNDVLNQEEKPTMSTQAVNLYPVLGSGKESFISSPNISAINIQSREEIAKTMQPPATMSMPPNLKNAAKNSIPMSKAKSSSELKEKVTVKTRAKVKQTVILHDF